MALRRKTGVPLLGWFHPTRRGGCGCVATEWYLLYFYGKDESPHSGPHDIERNVGGVLISGVQWFRDEADFIPEPAFDRSAFPGCLDVDRIPDAIHMLALAPGTVNRLRFVVRYRDDFLELLPAITADELVDRHDGLSFVHGRQLLKHSSCRGHLQDRRERRAQSWQSHQAPEADVCEVNPTILGPFERSSTPNKAKRARISAPRQTWPGPTCARSDGAEGQARVFPLAQSPSLPCRR